jgi:hypothetical protein
MTQSTCDRLLCRYWRLGQLPSPDRHEKTCCACQTFRADHNRVALLLCDFSELQPPKEWKQQLLGYCITQYGGKMRRVELAELLDSAGSFLRAFAGGYERAVLPHLVAWEDRGTKLHELGCTLAALEDAHAIAVFRDAIEAKRHASPINHQSIGESRHELACQLFRRNFHGEALSQLRMAIKEKEQGDAHGRTDSVNILLSSSLYDTWLASINRHAPDDVPVESVRKA